jgi:hypothetical protein
VRPLREVHDHPQISSYAFATKANLGDLLGVVQIWP